MKEACYHQRHAGDWVVRLGDGSTESRQRMESALEELWRYVPELFEADAIDVQTQQSGIGPDWSSLHAPWLAEMSQLLDEATLAVPRDSAFRSSGKRGVHSEHMGYILTEMQYLQRAYPGGVW